MGFVALSSRGHYVPVLAGLALVLLLLCAGRLSFSREWFAVGRTLGNSLAMRQQVQYALCLNHWLKLEASRCASLDDLYGDFVCAAGRLGFTTVKLTLADGERAWNQPRVCSHERTFRLALDGGQAGTLELRAPSCLAARACTLSTGTAEKGRPAACVHGDPALFEIMSELVAEGWTRAAAQAQIAGGPMRFDAPLPAVNGTSRRASRQTFPARPLGGEAPDSLKLEDDSVASS
jgi:hypothetical protein